MKKSILSVGFAALAAVALGACGNPLEGGSEPSGTILRVLGVDPQDVEPDMFITICDDGKAEEFTNEYVTVTLLNDSRPNTPEDEFTNSFTTIYRYRVDFAALNLNIDIPTIDGGGLGVGIAPDAQGDVVILVMDFDTREYIRNRYPEVGNGVSVAVRADITITGQDAFQVDVEAKASVTMVLADYDNCN